MDKIITNDKVFKTKPAKSGKLLENKPAKSGKSYWLFIENMEEKIKKNLIYAKNVVIENIKKGEHYWI